MVADAFVPGQRASRGSLGEHVCSWRAVQMLVVHLGKDRPEITEDIVLYPHGLTPPTRDMREKHFRQPKDVDVRSLPVLLLKRREAGALVARRMHPHR